MEKVTKRIVGKLSTVSFLIHTIKVTAFGKLIVGKILIHGLRREIGIKK